MGWFILYCWHFKFPLHAYRPVRSETFVLQMSICLSASPCILSPQPFWKTRSRVTPLWPYSPTDLEEVAKEWGCEGSRKEEFRKSPGVKYFDSSEEGIGWQDLSRIFSPMPFLLPSAVVRRRRRLFRYNTYRKLLTQQLHTVVMSQMHSIPYNWCTI